MPIHRYGTRYSRWDGTQQIEALTADDLMRAMSDDLMQDGDVNRALQRLFRWGFQRPDGEQTPVLQGLLQKLRERRQEQLERYDMQSMLSDIIDRLDQVIETERQGIAQRLDDASRHDITRPATGDQTASQPEQAADQADDQPSGAQQSGGDPGESAEQDDGLRRLLESLASKHLQHNWVSSI